MVNGAHEGGFAEVFAEIASAYHRSAAAARVPGAAPHSKIPVESLSRLRSSDDRGGNGWLPTALRRDLDRQCDVVGVP